MTTILGRDTKTGTLVTLGKEARSRNTYAMGATGTGKTTELQSIAYQDMKAGDGLCVLDPHGDMIDWLLEHVPEEREDDVILFNPADEEYPVGLNLLECDRENPKEVRWVVSTIMASIRRLYEWSWGPRLEYVLGHTLWTAMAIPDSTLLEVLLLLDDEDYRKEWIGRLEEPLLQNFWKIFPTHRRDQLEFTNSTINKLIPFLLDHAMRNIIGQSHSTFDLRTLMDEQKILLVNLSKGDLGEHNSALLGSVLINLILMAALSRRDMPVAERQKRPFHVIVDEYQNFASDSFSVLQSEARKYAVDLVVAHQFRDQLTLENRGSALNVGNFICFRTTGVDGPEMASQFDNTPPEPDVVWEPVRFPSAQFKDKFERGVVDEPVPGPRRLYSDVTLQKANELINLPPFQFEARIIEPDPDNPRRLVLAEHSLTTIDPEQADEQLIAAVYGSRSSERAARIRHRSQALAKPRQQVVEEIARRTFGYIGRDPQPGRVSLPASAKVEDSSLDWLLTSETDSLMMEE